MREIPSELIEPYLAKFMGTMVDFISRAAVTPEDKIWEHQLTVNEIKQWVKGVEMFVSISCGIHARYAMMNQCHQFCEMPNDVLKETCIEALQTLKVDDNELEKWLDIHS